MSTSPRVLNRHHTGVVFNACYIGRGSKYGNPFVIGVDGTREEVIAKFVCYAEERFTREEVMRDLEGRDLLCSCKPKACHGDWLLAWANPLM